MAAGIPLCRVRCTTWCQLCNLEAHGAGETKHIGLKINQLGPEQQPVMCQSSHPASWGALIRGSMNHCHSGGRPSTLAALQPEPSRLGPKASPLLQLYSAALRSAPPCD